MSKSESDITKLFVSNYHYSRILYIPREEALRYQESLKPGGAEEQCKSSIDICNKQQPAASTSIPIINQSSSSPGRCFPQSSNLNSQSMPIAITQVLSSSSSSSSSSCSSLSSSLSSSTSSLTSTSSSLSNQSSSSSGSSKSCSTCSSTSSYSSSTSYSSSSSKTSSSSNENLEIEVAMPFTAPNVPGIDSTSASTSPSTKKHRSSSSPIRKIKLYLIKKKSQNYKLVFISDAATTKTTTTANIDEKLVERIFF